MVLIVCTGQATRRHFVLVRARGLGRRTLKTIIHQAQTHTQRQTTRGQSAKSTRCHRPKPISCNFYSKQNCVHGLIPSSLIGRVTFLYMYTQALAYSSSSWKQIGNHNLSGKKISACRIFCRFCSVSRFHKNLRNRRLSVLIGVCPKSVLVGHRE